MNTYTEVHGAMYCVTHKDFALEGSSVSDCEGLDPYWSNDPGECDLRDLFIESGKA
jgi:hypothetical protein